MRVALREPLPPELWPLFGAKAKLPPMPAAAAADGGSVGKGAHAHVHRPIRQRKPAQIVNIGG